LFATKWAPLCSRIKKKMIYREREEEQRKKARERGKRKEKRGCRSPEAFCFFVCHLSDSLQWRQKTSPENGDNISGQGFFIIHAGSDVNANDVDNDNDVGDNDDIENAEVDDDDDDDGNGWYPTEPLGLISKKMIENLIARLKLCPFWKKRGPWTNRVAFLGIPRKSLDSGNRCCRRLTPKNFLSSISSLPSPPTWISMDFTVPSLALFPLCGRRRCRHRRRRHRRLRPDALERQYFRVAVQLPPIVRETAWVRQRRRRRSLPFDKSFSEGGHRNFFRLTCGWRRRRRRWRWRRRRQRWPISCSSQRCHPYLEMSLKVTASSHNWAYVKISNRLPFIDVLYQLHKAYLYM